MHHVEALHESEHLAMCRRFEASQLALGPLPLLALMAYSGMRLLSVERRTADLMHGSIPPSFQQCNLSHPRSPFKLYTDARIKLCPWAVKLDLRDTSFRCFVADKEYLTASSRPARCCCTCLYLTLATSALIPCRWQS